MTRRAHTLDTVKLLRDWEGWPAGTIASVVAEHPDTALVEVVTKRTRRRGSEEALRPFLGEGQTRTPPGRPRTPGGVAV